MLSRKRTILLASIVLPVALVVAVVVTQRVRAAPDTDVIVTESAGWFCPMHPDVVSDHEGSCPICGMHLVKRDADPGASTEHQHDGAHPHPGADHNPHADQLEPPDEHHHHADEHEHLPQVQQQVHVPPQVQQRMGLLLDTVEPVDFQPSVSVAAQAIADAQRTVSLSPKVDGWIERLGVSVVGQPVHKGQVLFEIYSPDLQQRQRDYIDLLARRDTLLGAKGGGMGAVGNTAPDLMLASVARERYRLRSRLLAADVPQALLEDIEKFRRVHDVVPVLAEYDGVVTGIGATEGAYVTPARTVVSYADPRAAWAELSMNPELLAQLGRAGEVELRSTVDGITRVSAQVDGSLAVVDAVSRTARIRVPLPAAGSSFLAGTLLEAELRMVVRTALVVASDAVIRTGHGDFLMVAGEADHFRQAPVQLGAESGDQVEVVSGLFPGERVVTNGQFLLSAESSLQASRQRLTRAHTAGTQSRDGVDTTNQPHAGHDHSGH